MKIKLDEIIVDTLFANNTWETIRRVQDYAREKRISGKKIYDICKWKEGDKKLMPNGIDKGILEEPTKDYGFTIALKLDKGVANEPTKTEEK